MRTAILPAWLPLWSDSGELVGENHVQALCGRYDDGWRLRELTVFTQLGQAVAIMDRWEAVAGFGLAEIERLEHKARVRSDVG